ncbi:hypothetical protein POV27_00730 [Aureisphaera galaxeae]|uniref:hypothetical protein n=1 Tax=Aureisphaera galaxeae TaxID=1538023 RepID=UPI0023503E9C|nr:hypothetical protein [Aureisphaera galaxeae]MDC8002561.1 hypothetical protein [Aureisphaera galaxeae]
MRNFNFFQQLFVLLLILSATGTVMAQDRGAEIDDPVNHFQEVTNTRMPINGTNTYDGLNAGTTGNYGSYFGANAGFSIGATPFYNTFMGGFSGYSTTDGQYNTYLGVAAGYRNTTGNYNTAVGFLAGFSAVTGERNVFLGNFAGLNETGSDKLYIDNSNTTTPLLFGDFAADKLGINTNQLPNSVGGANTSAYSLYVKGGILTEELRVRTGWADYVFESDYSLMPLNELEAYISTNGHLPNVPSATQVEAQGIELGDMARIQQEKIEELTLYIIELQKQVDALNQKVRDLSEK